MLNSVKKFFSSDLEAIIVILGIYSTYIYFGVLQEHIYTNPARDAFKYPEFVVFCQLLLSFIVSSICMLYIVLFFSPQHKRNLPPLKEVLLYGGTYGYSMFMTNFSLTLISYPTQALAKSCKILPAMIGSLFVKGVKYHPLQYLSVIFITLGVVIFNYNNKKGGSSDSIYGMLALFISLMLDAATSYYTETFKRKFNSSSLSQQQLCTGVGAALILPIVIMNNIYLPETTIFSYISKFPDVLEDILFFSLLSAFGNYFIFWGLNLLGSLNVVIITTTRKFATIIVSILWFSHSLTQFQVLCIGLVVFGAGLDIYVGHKGGHKKE